MRVGICFGGYCPMHQGHLDLIMRAKKENDICYVIVCGYDGEERGESVGLPLRRRLSLVKRLFKDDEQVRVLSVNDTELGIDESMSTHNWRVWVGEVNRLIIPDVMKNGETAEKYESYYFTWYVAEESYKASLEEVGNSSALKYKGVISNRVLPQSPEMGDVYMVKGEIEGIVLDVSRYIAYDNKWAVLNNDEGYKYSIVRPDACEVKYFKKLNPVSGTEIRKNPIKYWNKIAWTFRPHFSTNILITGTASEGKSTLTRDIATYFGIPYSEEYGRTYMEQMGKSDLDLTINDFQEFLMEQRRDTKSKIDSSGNNGIVISDTDNLVTLMYAQAYADDENIDMTWEDYKSLEALAKNIQRGITWDKIFLLPPKNKFVDDGTRYMAQSSLDERQKNYTKLVKLLKRFGWWDKVEVIDGNYLENFEKVKAYIESKLSC